MTTKTIGELKQDKETLENLREVISDKKFIIKADPHNINIHFPSNDITVIKDYFYDNLTSTLETCLADFATDLVCDMEKRIKDFLRDRLAEDIFQLVKRHTKYSSEVDLILEMVTDKFENRFNMDDDRVF